MSNQHWEAEVTDYINRTKFAVLAYVRGDKAPLLRSMGSFALAGNGFDLYFSSRQAAAKVGEIEANEQVSFFFEHDNQSLESWRNVLLIGRAEQVKDEAELNKAIERLGSRSPRFKERIAGGDLPNTAIFKIATREVEYLDYSKGFGSVQKFKL